METYRKWEPIDDLEETETLMHTGAQPDDLSYELEDILKEFEGDANAGRLAPQKEPPAEVSEQPEAPEQPEEAPCAAEAEGEDAPPEETDATLQSEEISAPAEDAAPMDFGETAAFIGQQVSDAIGAEEEEPEPVGDTTVDGLRQFFMEARRQSAAKKLRREQRRKEQAAAAAMAEAAAALAEAEAEAQAAAEEAARQEAENADNVVEIPTPRAKVLRDSLGRLQDKANDFADNMYRDAGRAEQDTSFRDIPGTDAEDAPESRRFRLPKLPHRELPRAEDTPADELASRYRLGLAFMRQRIGWLAVLTVVMIYLSIAGDCGLPLPALLSGGRLAAGILTWGLALGSAIGLDVLWMGLTAPLRGRPGMHTLTSLAVLTTLADGIYSATAGREGPLPFSAMALVGLLGAMIGAYQRKQALYMACHSVENLSEPERVTLDPDKWNGVSAFSKETGTLEGFGSQIQSMDGAQRIYRVTVPVLGVAAVCFALVASLGRGRPELLLWCLSTIFVAAAPVAGLMAFGQPYLRLSKRLDRTGATLAGWDGVKSMTGRANILVKDEDLFPEGNILMKSIKHFEGVSLEKLTGCTASMLRAADSGLYHLFDSELRRQGGFYRRVDNLECYEAGGLTADIRGDQVLIGTQGFLNVMNIKLEGGIKVRRAVYCVINKKLEGIFSLNYEMNHYEKESLQALVRGDVSPVLATRDFNVIPSMLEAQFELPVDQMEYPTIERRWELSEPGQQHNSVLGALLSRTGMAPYSDAVLGARRLYTVVRLNAIIAVLASLVGVLLGFYLTWSMAFASLTPLTMLVFLLIWAVPNLAISGAVDKF